MVFVTAVFRRIPVIKFRKGGTGGPGASAAASAPSPAAASAAGAAPQQTQTMSTSAIPDIDLPLRYQRQPISEEEIAHINGGGIV
ncbi:uncharacterized protein LOC126371892 [Pectinophora gossypiella]|uniref:uncharacterized protein LOC126371892 n=1 Tax=Pectinophora gossypiella TaxID=13191 RepID=UPI00214E42D7|nr:uncharacterized protein LOC126371892 [Pectinophora gossypiella]